MWGPVAERYGLDITVVNTAVDPTFRFMTLDHDGKIRMDCSSPFAMAGLVQLKDRFDVAFGGGRRDEDKARAKERVLSHRDRFGPGHGAPL